MYSLLYNFHLPEFFQFYFNASHTPPSPHQTPKGMDVNEPNKAEQYKARVQPEFDLSFYSYDQIQFVLQILSSGIVWVRFVESLITY